MSFELRIDDDGDVSHYSLGTTQGVASLSRWAESLPDQGYDRVRAFFTDGSVTGTDTLATQLRDAIDLHGPDEFDTEHTAENLAKLLGVGDRDEIASIE